MRYDPAGRLAAVPSPSATTSILADAPKWTVCRPSIIATRSVKPSGDWSIAVPV